MALYRAVITVYPGKYHQSASKPLNLG